VGTQDMLLMMTIVKTGLLYGAFAAVASTQASTVTPRIPVWQDGRTRQATSLRWRRTQSAQMAGGRPPKTLDAVAACGIDSMFTKLSQVRNSPDCQAGCTGGTCPPDWMPGGDDVCSADCGVIFEPFCIINLRSPTHAPLLLRSYCRALLKEHGLRRGSVWRDADKRWDGGARFSSTVLGFCALLVTCRP
jgi:hypothetical protein